MISEDGPDCRLLSCVTIKRARKEHRCEFCKQTIPVGTRYMRNNYVEDGKFRSEAVHDIFARCVDDREQDTDNG